MKNTIFMKEITIYTFLKVLTFKSIGENLILTRTVYLIKCIYSYGLTVVCIKFLIDQLG